MYKVIDIWYDKYMFSLMQKADPEQNFREEDLIADICTTVSSTMAYLENFRSEVIIKEVDVPMTNTQRRKAEWHNKNNHNKTVRLKKYIFTIPNGVRYNNPDRKKYVRYAECWSVRGHYRTLKSGKKIWVRPHTKGEGGRKAKTYKIVDK